MVPGAHPSAAADFRTLKPRTSESRDRAENVKLQLAVWHGRVDPLGRHQIDARAIRWPGLRPNRIAVDGSILRSVISRRSWRQRRAVPRFLLSQFCGNLPKQTGRERPHVERLTRFEFELLRVLVARAVEHRRGDAHGQGPIGRLLGFLQHFFEDIERGMLERPQTLDRLLLHVRRRATVITADSAT
jgi:hypothetical protein